MFYHCRSHKLLILMTAYILVAGAATSASGSDRLAPDSMGILVNADWLSQHLHDSDLVVLDCTVHMEPKEGGGLQSTSGRADYESGHIPSAGFADLKGDLSDTSSSFDFALPTPEQFCAAMGALGVGDDSRVVLYDNFNSVWAARVWWMLRWVGFDRAAVLDGGLKAWTAAGQDLATEPADCQTRQLTPDPRPSLIVDRDEVFAAIEDEAVALVDAMHEAHFSGQMVMYGRPGHIPGASNVSAMALLDESGRYRPLDELAAMFEDDHNTRVITYCGAGVAASSDALVLVRLGFKDVAVYMASLQEWVSDPANPLVVDGD